MKQVLGKGNKGKRYRIAFLEDHDLLREAMISSLKSEYNISAVISEGEGTAFLQRLEQLEELPDLCVVDLLMKGMNGMEVMTVCKKKWPQLKFIVLSAYGWDINNLRCLRLGVKGYFSKTVSLAVLYNGIVDVIEKGAMYSRSFDDDLIEKSRELLELDGLTATDAKVIKGVIKYPTLEEAASSLHVTRTCLQSRKQRVYKKLLISTKMELIKAAICYGVISLEELDNDDARD